MLFGRFAYAVYSVDSPAAFSRTRMAVNNFMTMAGFAVAAVSRSVQFMNFSCAEFFSSHGAETFMRRDVSSHGAEICHAQRCVKSRSGDCCKSRAHISRSQGHENILWGGCCRFVVHREAETLQFLKSGSSGTATDDGGSVAQP